MEGLLGDMALALLNAGEDILALFESNMGIRSKGLVAQLTGDLTDSFI